MSKSVKNWFKSLSRKGNVSVVSGTLLASVIGLGIAGAGTNNVATEPALNSSPRITQLKPAEPVVTHQTVTTTEVVPFTSTSQNDATLAKGATKILTAGVSGVRTYLFDVTYTNGTETGRSEVSSNITAAPINQIVAIGTYVAPVQPSCPNGNYVNSAGNTVCSPYNSPSQPAGASALCADGSYSFSQSRSGTCSHHGGVAQWL